MRHATAVRFELGESGKSDAVHIAQLVAERYRLEAHLASGGMGEVWTALDQLLDRRVALKLLHPNLAVDDAFRRRFHAEAKAAARLSHPGVVAIYDYGEDDEVIYLAMELVEGEPLSQVLRRRGTLTLGETTDFLAQSADALAAAHARGFVHRDVKPGNLLVRTDGRVKVTDFGIARATDTTTITVDGTVLGTVAYMSPEQVRGGRVTPASDIYSLGVVAYECLVGTRPYAASDSIAVALAHLHDPVPELPPTVPEGVRALVTSMLQKSPATRPPSARSVARRARALSAGGSIPNVAASGLPTAPVPGPGTPTTTARRHDATSGTPSTQLQAPTRTHTATARVEHTQTKPFTEGARAPVASEGPPPSARATPTPIARHSLAVAVVAVVCLLLSFVLATLGSTSASGARTGRTVAVPDVVGATVRAARAELAALGLHASFGGTTPPANDTIAAQRPRPGHRSRRGSEVHLRVQAAHSTPTSIAGTSSATSTSSTTTPGASSSPPAVPGHGHGHGLGHAPGGPNGQQPPGKGHGPGP